MAVPITQYVLKVHSRCNLACDHCYVYEHADQGWRMQPLAMAPEVVAMAATRISEHAAAHRAAAVSVVLHGGEPLLLGRDRMRGLLAELTARVGAVTTLGLRMQTNAVLLDEHWCDLLREYGVKVGVSLDGDRVANDRHRNFADGRGSYRQVLDALRLLRRPANRELFAGLLCTIDLANEPEAVYRALAAQHPPSLDLLLPHATWERPPRRPDGQRAPYADWLLRVYRCWDADGRPMPVRLFDSLLSAARGSGSFTESLGTDPKNLLVIETDGAWEQADSLKTAFDGAAATGLSVFSHSVDMACAHPGVATRLDGVAGLCATCRACPVVTICGGGLYAHRFRAGGSGFGNPSVYCADLSALIEGVLAAERGPLAEARLLVAAVAGSTAGWHDAELRSAAEQGWELLCALSREHPRAVDDVLGDPHTYAWAVRCLRRGPGADTDLDRAHLASLALAAAFRAGVPAALPAPVRDGYAHLPTVGALATGPGTRRTANISVTPDRPPAMVPAPAAAGEAVIA